MAADRRDGAGAGLGVSGSCEMECAAAEEWGDGTPERGFAIRPVRSRGNIGGERGGGERLAKSWSQGLDPKWESATADGRR